MRDQARSRTAARLGTSQIITGILLIIASMIGLVAAVYLGANGLYLVFLAVVFGQNAPGITTLDYLTSVAVASMPACCAAALGTAGFRCLRSERFRAVGLAAVVVETTLAIYVYAEPESMLIFL